MRPDIVIADLSMEGKNGYDVCAAIKGDPALSRIPVLLLHGTSVGWDESKAKAARADGEITKPFESQMVIDRVKGVLEAPMPAAAREPMGPITSLAPPIESEDLVIDTGAVSAPTPAVAKPAAARGGAARPAPAAAKPAAAPPTAKPAAARPLPATAKPAAAKPADQDLSEIWGEKAAPSQQPTKAAIAPVTPKPAPPRPPPGAKPIARQPPVAAAKPAPGSAPRPLPKAPPPKEPEAVEITIEAEPPPVAMARESFPSFEAPVIEPAREIRPQATMMGLGGPGLPPPPAGMALPSAVAPAEQVRPSMMPYDPAAYEAIAKMTREVIEKIVWEVVPDLAEKIIREELDRLVENRRR
jgi:CheY-like chemotaxis protein